LWKRYLKVFDAEKGGVSNIHQRENLRLCKNPFEEKEIRSSKFAGTNESGADDVAGQGEILLYYDCNIIVGDEVKII